MPLIRNDFSTSHKINTKLTETKKPSVKQQNTSSLSTTQKIMIGTTALAAVVIGGLMVRKHFSGNTVKNAISELFARNQKQTGSNNKLIKNKNKMTFDNPETAMAKINDTITNPPVIQGGKPVKKGQQDIIYNNTDKTQVVRGKSILNEVEIITPQEHSAYSRRIKYKRPTIKQQRAIADMHEQNAQQRAALNTIGNSKNGQVLQDLLNKLS